MLTAVAILFLLIIFLAFGLSRKTKLATEEPEEQSIFKSTQKYATEYLSGHPQIEKQGYVYLVKEPGNIHIVERKLYSNTPPYNRLATIPFKAITAINVKEGERVKKKFSLGKFMVIGVYAFAWPKKEKIEMGYLIIKWKVANSDHTTIFKNEEDGALDAVTKARAALLHWIAEA